MNKGIMAAMAVAAVAVGGILASPLFYDTKVDEALPAVLSDMQEGLTLERFSNMDEKSRSALVDAMPEEIKEMIMDESAKTQKVVHEDMEGSGKPQVVKTGRFVGLAGHSAEGDAKVLDISGTQYLRFENFEVTNGPDLRVYITQGGDVKDGIHLDRLKGSKGAQNYLIDGIDTDAYDTVVIYCQPFGVYFGEAALG